MKRSVYTRHHKQRLSYFTVILLVRGKTSKRAMMITFRNAAIKQTKRGLMTPYGFIMIVVQCMWHTEISKAQHYRDICEGNFYELLANLEKSVNHKFHNKFIKRYHS